MSITQQRLIEVLHYDMETGDFRWKQRPVRSKGDKIFNGKHPGKLAGCPHTKGYLTIGIDGEWYLAHRLAWLYVTGSFPKVLIDHRDGNGRNNAIDNLREADFVQNGGNQGLRKNNTSGFKGVKRFGGDGWRATIKEKHLGCFKTIDEARAAYDAAAQDTYGDFARSS